MTRIPPQLSILDYILAGLGAVLSTYSVGMSVGYPNLAAFLAVLVTLATGLGFLLGKATRGKKIARFDITFWTILAIACWILVFPLNAALPEGGFPFRLMAAASLCWMLIFCSVFSWRDQTLLFLSLPSIALFGLVGTFDTYYYGTALFFAFLISTGVLYARVHQRGMMKRAERAGQVDVDLLWRGPWKWMAGPEWALASGFLVVLVSMVGAPAFKESVRNVAGNIKVSLPTNTTPLSARSGSSQQTGYFVGRGPTRATDDPLFKVKGNGFNYLRRDTALSQYTGRGWSATTVTLHEDNAEINASRSSDDPMLTGPNGGLMAYSLGSAPGEKIIDPIEVPFELRPIRDLPKTILSPGPISEVITPQDDLVFRGTGEVISTNVSIKDAVKAVATMPRTANIPKNVLAQIDVDRERAYLNKDRIDPRVRSLALSVAGDSSLSDFEKAHKIKQEIESRVKYNLAADAVPKDNDASAFFLFESKEGYCDLFATTMVNMARSVDLPARFVLGYLITPGPADANGFTTVRSKDYHAWAEIYFEGYGWIPFDPTEGAEAVPGFGVGSTMNPGFQLTDEALRVIGIAFVVLALVVPLVFFAGRSFLRGMGGTARKHGELLRHHSKFQRILEQTSGKPKRFSHTLPEYTKFISDTLDVNAGEAHAIAGAFDSAFFAPEEPDQESIKKLGERVASFRETLRHARPTSS